MAVLFLVPLTVMMGWTIVREFEPDEAPQDGEAPDPAPVGALPDDWRDAPTGRAPSPEPGESVGREIPPWEATPENTPPAPSGTVAAYELARPPSETPDPLEPIPPPDPHTTTPPRHNPGGVDGERGPRPTVQRGDVPRD